MGIKKKHKKKKIDYYHDFCRCGNIKFKKSKTCQKCFTSMKHRQLSRMPKGRRPEISDYLIKLELKHLR